MARYPGFVGPAYRSQNPIAAADTLINWYPEKIESGTGKATYQFLPCPGFTQFCDLGTSHPIRQQFTLNGATFVVSGTTLYQAPFVLGGSATTLATGITNPDDSIVSMAGNGDGGFQIVIASAGILYCYDIRTDTLTQIPDISASFVTFVDGSFYALNPSTSNLYVSAPEDGSSWDAADVIQRLDNPDKWIAMLLSHGELFLAGSQTGSVYYDSGAADFPFTPNPSGKLQEGILAPNSAQLIDGEAIWLSANALGGAKVVKAQGYNMQRISTHALEYAFSQYSTLSDADAFTYQEQGHSFYVLHFPTANATWVYDNTTGLWHQRGLWDGNTFGVMDVRTHTYAQGVHLVGSRSDGVIWQMTSDVFTDTDGNGMFRQRRAPHLCEELHRTIYDRLQLDMEVGVGLSSGQGYDPLVMLRWSDDGGQSWSNVQTASAGAIGEFKARVIWRKLGQARDRVFEVSVSDPIGWRLVDAYLESRAGAF